MSNATKDPVAQDQKTLTKASIQDRALLYLLTHRTKVDALTAEPEALISELKDDMGLNQSGLADQIVQSPELRTAERDANRELAVSSAKAAGLVADDHEAAPDNPVAAKDQHPTSAAPATPQIPAGAPASEVKPTPDAKK